MPGRVLVVVGDGALTNGISYEGLNNIGASGLPIVIILNDSGAQDLILRPLSAKLLPPTKPEREGWVNRSLLLDIQGRSRQRQLDLAQTLGINDYPCPLADAYLLILAFHEAPKIFQYWKDDIDRPFLELSKVGRHFWTGSDLIVVARNEQESYSLRALMKVWDYKVELTDVPGPTTLVRSRGKLTEEVLGLSALLTARYSKARTLPLVKVKAENYLFLRTQKLQVKPSALTETMERMNAEQL